MAKMKSEEDKKLDFSAFTFHLLIIVSNVQVSDTTGDATYLKS